MNIMNFRILGLELAVPPFLSPRYKYTCTPLQAQGTCNCLTFNHAGISVCNNYVIHVDSVCTCVTVCLQVCVPVCCPCLYCSVVYFLPFFSQLNLYCCVRVLCFVHCASRSVFALSYLLPRKGSDGDDDIGQLRIDGHGKGRNKIMVCLQANWPFHTVCLSAFYIYM